MCVQGGSVGVRGVLWCLLAPSMLHSLSLQYVTGCKVQAYSCGVAWTDDDTA